MANKIKLAGTSSNTFSVGLQGATISSNAVSTPYTLTLPANTGTNTQVLTTDGTGNLSWTNAGGGGGGSPGGANTQLQYNNNGTFGGISTVTYALGNLTLGAVGNVKITGGSNNYILATDGTGNLSFSAKTNNLTIGTRTISVNIPITDYTMNVQGRTGNITVNVN